MHQRADMSHLSSRGKTQKMSCPEDAALASPAAATIRKMTAAVRPSRRGKQSKNAHKNWAIVTTVVQRDLSSISCCTLTLLPASTASQC